MNRLRTPAHTACTPGARFECLDPRRGSSPRVCECANRGHSRFDGALLTRDTNALEPDVAELKFYAPGVGPVLTLDVSGGNGREELISVTTVPDGTGTDPLGSPDP